MHGGFIVVHPSDEQEGADEGHLSDIPEGEDEDWEQDNPENICRATFRR